MPYTVDLTDDGHLKWPPIKTTYPHQRLMKSSQDLWIKVLKVLAKGPVKDESGQATAKLAKRVRWGGVQTSFNNQLVGLEEAGLIRRDKTTTRTHAIHLAIDADVLPPEWFASNGHKTERGTFQDDVVVPVPDEAVTDATEAVEASPEEDRPVAPITAEDVLEAATADEYDYRLLATALLERVVELVTAEPSSNGDGEGYDRSVALSVMLTNANNVADKLRKRVQSLERDYAIHQGTIKALRATLAEEQRVHRLTDENLQRVLAAARRFDANNALDEDQRRELDRVLREIPLSPTTQRMER